VKLDPKQVTFLRPFLAGLRSEWLTFSGRRNTVHLQETALVVEGDLLLFKFLGLERFFARAMSEYTTVTVPYSRLVAVKPRRKVVLRTLVRLAAAGALVMLALATLDAVWKQSATAAFVAYGLLAALVVLGAWFVLRHLRPSFTIRFRARDGKQQAFVFAVRSVPLWRTFAAALKTYRDAAAAFPGGTPEDRR
jgi:hypothetical protein